MSFQSDGLIYLENVLAFEAVESLHLRYCFKSFLFSSKAIFITEKTFCDTNEEVIFRKSRKLVFFLRNNAISNRSFGLMICSNDLTCSYTHYKSNRTHNWEFWIMLFSVLYPMIILNFLLLKIPNPNIRSKQSNLI